MVVIRRVRAVNIRRLNINDLELERGFYIIKGRNEAGKSTLVEAILFALYGDYQVIADLRGNPRGGYAEAVNHRARRALIEVEFEVDGKRFRVSRELIKDQDSIKQVSARLVEISDGSEKLVATGVRPVNEQVQRLLRVSWKEMLATNIVAQKDLERIIHMGKGDREQIINLMMGLESYNKAIQNLEEIRREKKGEKDNLQKIFEEKSKRVQDLEKKVSSIPEWKTELSEIESKTPSLNDRERILKSALEYMVSLRQAIRRRKELEQQKKNIEDRIEMIQRRINEEEERIRKNSESVGRIQSSLPGLTESLEKVQKELASSEITYEEKLRLLSDLKSYNQYRDNEYRRLKQIEEELQGLEKDKERLEKTQKELEFFQRQKEQLEFEMSHLKLPVWSKLASSVSIIVSVSIFLLNPLLGSLLLLGGAFVLFLGFYQRSSRRQLLLQQLRNVEPEITSRMVVIQEIEKRKKRLEELEREKREVEKHIQELESEIKRLAGSESNKTIGQAIDSLEKELKALSDKVEELKRREGELRTRRELASKELQRLQEEIKESGLKLEELRKEKAGLEEQKEKIIASMESIVIPPLPQELVGKIEYVEVVAEELDPELVDVFYEKLNDEYIGVSREKARLEERAKELRKNIEEAEALKPQLEQLRAELDKLTNDIKSLEEDVKAVDKAIEAMREISRKRREIFAPSVENYMSEIIGYFTNGRYKAVRLQPETYDIEVFDSEAGRWLRRDIYSGGTNDQFLLALRIAFTLALLPSTKGSYPRFIVLDEPLGSSDVERREKIMEFFSSELSRFFDQIFLITHVDVEEPPGTTIIEIEEGKVTRMYKVGSAEA